MWQQLEHVVVEVAQDPIDDMNDTVVDCYIGASDTTLGTVVADIHCNIEYRQRPQLLTWIDFNLSMEK